MKMAQSGAIWLARESLAAGGSPRLHDELLPYHWSEQRLPPRSCSPKFERLMMFDIGSWRH